MRDSKTANVLADVAPFPLAPFHAQHTSRGFICSQMAQQIIIDQLQRI